MAQKKKGSGASRKSKKAASKSSRKKAVSKSGKKPARKKAPGRKQAPGRKKASSKKKSASRKASAGKAGRGSTRKPARKAGGKKKTAAKRTPARTPKSAKGASKRAPGRDAAFFDHFRQKLLDQRQQITRRLDELREELRGLEQTPRELEEWAQEEKDRDILIRLEDRETEELRKIQAALGLIDRKEYGYCQNCGKPIPRARLEELPTAFRCVDCTS